MKYSESMRNLTDIYLVQVYTIERCDHFSDREYAQVKLNKSNKKTSENKTTELTMLSAYCVTFTLVVDIQGCPALFF